MWGLLTRPWPFRDILWLSLPPLSRSESPAWWAVLPFPISLSPFGPSLWICCRPRLGWGSLCALDWRPEGEG